MDSSLRGMARSMCIHGPGRICLKHDDDLQYPNSTWQVRRKVIPLVTARIQIACSRDEAAKIMVIFDPQILKPAVSC